MNFTNVLTRDELKAIKGGAFTCQCGWESDPVGPEFTYGEEVATIDQAVQNAYLHCLSIANGAAHCSGDGESISPL